MAMWIEIVSFSKVTIAQMTARQDPLAATAYKAGCDPVKSFDRVRNLREL
jgi:hypothetical protein